MNVGASQVDITPDVGVELSGFAARTQPSVGVLDPLYARALYLVEGYRRLLWIHLDLIGVDRNLVGTFRAWARRRAGLAEDQVLISATHTHSGPPTIDLLESGRHDLDYVRWLHGRLILAAEQAMAYLVACDVVCAHGYLDLAVDRRGTPTAHTDPRVGAVGFRSTDGRFIAAVVNHAMHAVALGASNRMISADVPGQVARHLSRALAGAPIVLATNGACGNLNPPAENVPPHQVERWGRLVAEAVVGSLRMATPIAQPAFATASLRVPVPLEPLTVARVEEYTDRALGLPDPIAEWGDKYRRAVATWRNAMIEAIQENRIRDAAEVELFGVRFGPQMWLGVSAEVFSDFAGLVAASTGESVYVVGYANGDIGYIPTLSAFQEGGYEVEIAHLFHGTPPMRAGGLELLADRAASVITRLASGETIRPHPSPARISIPNPSGHFHGEDWGKTPTARNVTDIG